VAEGQGGKSVANRTYQVGDQETRRADSLPLDMKLEVVVMPVADVARSKEFYASLGWRLDADVVADNGSRLIQFTPPGSGCSIQFGTNLFGNNVASMAPGSAQGLYLIVSDIRIARDQLIGLGVDASDVFHCAKGFACRFPGQEGRISGPQPEGGSYGSFVSFRDPDGNGWLLQEVTTRLPGRIAGETSYGSARDLSEALRRAEAAHGEHEARIGHADPNWPQWYADYLVREQRGEDPPP
jgi:catechol 2,3-dioxygenase-like lactoylglutathione lyase family enzyme